MICTIKLVSISNWKETNPLVPKECLGQGWNKEHKDTNSPHITQLINRFNMVLVVVKEILPSRWENGL